LQEDRESSEKRVWELKALMITSIRYKIKKVRKGNRTKGWGGERRGKVLKRVLMFLVGLRYSPLVGEMLVIILQIL
jgi:hypothetical protein